MTSFFNFKKLRFALKTALVAFCFCTPFDLRGQTTADIAEMPRRAIGLNKVDSSIARKGLQLIPKDKYAYIAIHGEGSVFKIVEGNVWKTISHKSLAKWIADNRTYDDRTLVLLSCSDTTSTQLLANQLVQYDTTAVPKRNVRKIMGWDNEVELYENGYVDGYGFCRIFSPQLAGTKQPPIPQIVSDSVAPHGSNKLPDETINYVVLGVSSPERLKILALTDPQVTAKQAINPDYLNKLANSWRAFKVDFVRNYLEDPTIITKNPNKGVKPMGVPVQIDALLKGWLTLKHYHSIGRTYLTGDYDILISAKNIFEKSYYSAPATANSIQSAFTQFLDSGKDPEKTILALGAALDELTFLDIIKKAGTKQLLNPSLTNPTATFLGITGLSDLEANLKLLNTIPAQGSFVTSVKNYLGSPSIIPAVSTGLSAALLDKLLLPQKNATGVLVKGVLAQNYVGSKIYVEDVTPALVAALNKEIGEFINYNQFLLLTGSTGVLNHVATKGSLFEHWGFKQHNLTLPLVLGQVLLRKNPTNVNISAGLSEGKRVIIDFHYPVGNQIVAVEFKHATDVPSDQLTARQALLAVRPDGTPSVINRFIYVFAELPTAAVVAKIKNQLGTITDCYYFLNGVLKKF